MPPHPLAIERLRATLAVHPEARFPEREAMAERFRQRFPLEALRRLDGEALLLELHGRASRDALVYWLEFKNDADFASRRFGSISGGSALKFGIYQRAEDGGWYVSAPNEPNRQRRVSLAEAVGIAARQRDQILAAVASITPDGPTQGAIEAAAPDLVQLAFLHKLLHLWHPTLVDDYHSVDHQVHHLIHLGVVPPGRALYTNAGALREAWQASALDLPFGDWSTVLNLTHGPPVRWWKVGTGTASDPSSEWPALRDAEVVGLGYSELGDLDELTRGVSGEQARQRVRAGIQGQWPTTAATQLGVDTNYVWNFYANLTEGSRVLTMSGQQILGVARVKGPYRFDPRFRFAHTRPVEWLTLTPFKWDARVGYMRSVYALDGAPDLLRAAVVQTLEHPASASLRPTPPGAAPVVTPSQPPPPPLPPKVAEMVQELERKGQIVLFGPPGTGKTWYARKVAEALAGRGPVRSTDALWGGGAPEDQHIWACTFHPGYGYEDFVEGLRPVPVPGGLDFRPRRGLLRVVADAAARRPAESFVLLVDELNRGDVPRIFGELLTLLEADKRGRLHVSLPVSGDRFTVPPNLYLLATMNTADRSIALLDSALRRRFAFLELLPEPELLRGGRPWGLALDLLLQALNQRLRRALGPDGRNLQIGHSYFLRNEAPLHDPAELRRVLYREVFPLLQEYCYDDRPRLAEIVGPGLYDADEQAVANDLSDDELRAALLDWGDVAADTAADEVAEDA